MDVVTAVSTLYRALETGDPALAHAAVAPDWIDHEASLETGLTDLRGPACLLAVGAWLRAGLPDLRFEELVTVADDEHALSYCVFTGLRDGRIVSHAAVRDDLGMFVQLGLMPPSPAALGRGLGWRLSGRAKRAVREVGAAVRRAAEAAGRPVDA